MTFSPEFAVIATSPIDALSATLLLRPRPGGGYHVQQYRSGAREDDPQSHRYADIRSDGILGRIFAEHHPEAPTEVAINVPGYMGGSRIPFAPRPFYEVAGDGSRSFLATTSFDEAEATISVAAFDQMGDTLFTREIVVKGEILPVNVRDSALDAQIARLPMNASAAEVFREKARFPPVYPPLEGVVVGNSGEVWIRLRVNATEVEYVMLDLTGAVTGRLTLPRSVEIRAFDRGTAWAVVRNSLDIPSLVKYRISRPSERA
jgi:hypothetical protein